MVNPLLIGVREKQQHTLRHGVAIGTCSKGP